VKTPAAIYLEREKAMVIDDIDIPEPGPTQVVVKQFATGVCHSQLHELHRPAPAFPLVLGHESTGVVVATGSNVTHVQTKRSPLVGFLPAETLSLSRLWRWSGRECALAPCRSSRR
jgi:Zn-dependent alcohol dehydrogenase